MDLLPVYKLLAGKFVLYGTNATAGTVSDNRKEYDVFLSYANQDSQYVEDILLSGLERPEKAEAQRYKCLIHSRDWAPGTAIPDQILQSVDNSRRTVIVLSNNYLQSMWSNMEFQAAHVKTMEENIQVEL